MDYISVQTIDIEPYIVTAHELSRLQDGYSLGNFVLEILGRYVTKTSPFAQTNNIWRFRCLCRGLTLLYEYALALQQTTSFEVENTRHVLLFIVGEIERFDDPSQVWPHALDALISGIIAHVHKGQAEDKHEPIFPPTTTIQLEGLMQLPVARSHGKSRECKPILLELILSYWLSPRVDKTTGSNMLDKIQSKLGFENLDNSPRIVVAFWRQYKAILSGSFNNDIDVRAQTNAINNLFLRHFRGTSILQLSDDSYWCLFVTTCGENLTKSKTNRIADNSNHSWWYTFREFLRSRFSIDMARDFRSLSFSETESQDYIDPYGYHENAVLQKTSVQETQQNLQSGPEYHEITPRRTTSIASETGLSDQLQVLPPSPPYTDAKSDKSSHKEKRRFSGGISWSTSKSTATSVSYDLSRLIEKHNHDPTMKYLCVLAASSSGVLAAFYTEHTICFSNVSSDGQYYKLEYKWHNTLELDKTKPLVTTTGLSTAVVVKSQEIMYCRSVDTDAKCLSLPKPKGRAQNLCQIESVLYLADNSYILAGTSDSSIYCWNLQTGESKNISLKTLPTIKRLPNVQLMIGMGNNYKYALLATIHEVKRNRKYQICVSSISLDDWTAVTSCIYDYDAPGTLATYDINITHCYTGVHYVLISQRESAPHIIALTGPSRGDTTKLKLRSKSSTVYIKKALCTSSGTFLVILSPLGVLYWIMTETLVSKKGDLTELGNLGVHFAPNVTPDLTITNENGQSFLWIGWTSEQKKKPSLNKFALPFSAF